MSNNSEFTSPAGRIVWGDLYVPNTKDFDGNAMTIKSGPDAGKPTQLYQFGLAVTKTQAHFANEPGWGQLAWAVAHAAFPGGDKSVAMSRDFSWKIEDGDSKTIGVKSKSKIPPCDREGYKGCWIIRFSSSFAPKIYDATRDADNPPLLDTVDAVMPGDYVMVAGTMAGNTGKSPGIYINPRAVGLKALGVRIQSAGIDVKGKFGGAVPAGAALAPAGFTPPPAAAAPAAPAPAYAPPAAPAPAPAAAPTAVVPAPGVVGIPTAPAAPAAPAAAPPPPVSRPAWNGHPFDSYIAAGWTVEQMRAQGYTG